MMILPEVIIEVVAEMYGVSVKELTGTRRFRNLVEPRHKAMQLIRELSPGYSYPRIAHMFNLRNHSSVIHACRKDLDLSDERSAVSHRMSKMSLEDIRAITDTRHQEALGRW